MVILPLLLIALPGLSPWSAEGVTGLIEILGDPDIEVRNRAQDALRRNLPAMVPELRAHQAHRDSEVAARCRALLEEFRDLWWRQGKIDVGDADSNCLALYLRLPDRLMYGDRLQVTRRGEKVGIVRVTRIRDWGAWVKPDDETPLQNYQRWDVVERIEYTGR